jgi:hypothetical protein
MVWRAHSKWILVRSVQVYILWATFHSYPTAPISTMSFNLWGCCSFQLLLSATGWSQDGWPTGVCTFPNLVFPKRRLGQVWSKGPWRWRHHETVLRLGHPFSLSLRVVATEGISHNDRETHSTSCPVYFLQQKYNSRRNRRCLSFHFLSSCILLKYTTWVLQEKHAIKIINLF